MEHISDPFSVERLAKGAGVRPRGIARLFMRQLNITPHSFVEGIRVDEARNLLEATDLDRKVVAFDCGFASPDQMRSAFQRKLGVTPLRYCENFQILS
jgi:transcriptional regulator GlxA family with amidase domain